MSNITNNIKKMAEYKIELILGAYPYGYTKADWEAEDRKAFNAYTRILNDDKTHTKLIQEYVKYLEQEIKDGYGEGVIENEEEEVQLIEESEGGSMKEVSKKVTDNKLSAIGKLMSHGITQFEVNTSSIDYTLQIIVKQAIKPEYSKWVAKELSTLDYIDDHETFMVPRPGNNEHEEVCINLYMKEC